MKNLTEIQAQNRMIKDLLIWIFLPENAATIASVPSFEDAATLLQGQSDAVTNLFAQYVKILKGIAEQRRDARINLANDSFVKMQAARAYFVSENNLDAAAQLNIPVSILQRAAYINLGNQIASAQSTIAPEVVNLAPYNITPASFLAWQNSLSAYNALQSAHAGISERKSTGGQITKAMKAAMKTLKTQCDPTVHTIQNQNFTATYFNNRRLVQEGVHHTGARVQLQDEMGQPFGSQISVMVNSFTKNNRSYKSVAELTDNTGLAEVSAFEPGERTITVSGQGIITQTYGPFIFQKSKILELVLTCQPQFESLPPAPQPQSKKVNN